MQAANRLAALAQHYTHPPLRRVTCPAHKQQLEMLGTSGGRRGRTHYQHHRVLYICNHVHGPPRSWGRGHGAVRSSVHSCTARACILLALERTARIETTDVKGRTTAPQPHHNPRHLHQPHVNLQAVRHVYACPPLSYRVTPAQGNPTTNSKRSNEYMLGRNNAQQ